MLQSLPPKCARRFRPERPLASGGFGAVWLATQVELGRPAAVKVLAAPEGATAEMAARFRSEARVTAQLAHPGIVRVIDYDVDEGVPWIAFEFVEGGSLAETIAQGPLPVAEALAMGAQVAAALEAAHAASVIHRDVKAENVLESAPGRYKLADFGIAKWRAGGEVKTQAGLVVGTPTHMAPEILSGAEPGPAADVYAWGVTVYHALTGRLPFEDVNLAALFEAHRTRAPEPPSRWVGGVPHSVDRVVLRALAKSPAERFADAGQLVAALDELERTRAAASSASGPTIRIASRAPAKSAGAGSRAHAAAAASRPGARLAVAAGLAAAASLAVGLAIVARASVREPAIPTPVPSAPQPDTSPSPVAESQEKRIAAAHRRWMSYRRSFLKRARLYRDELHMFPSDSVDNAQDVAPDLKRGLVDARDLVIALDRAPGATDADWMEAICLAHAVFDELGRLSEPDVRTFLLADMRALEQAARAPEGASVPRAALAELVQLRVVLESTTKRTELVEPYQRIMRTLAPPVRPMWSVTPAAVRTRMLGAFQTGMLFERQQGVGQTPPAVERRDAWQPLIDQATEARHIVGIARPSEAGRHGPGMVYVTRRMVNELRERGAAPKLFADALAAARGLRTALAAKLPPDREEAAELAVELKELESALEK